MKTNIKKSKIVHLMIVILLSIVVLCLAFFSGFISKNYIDKKQTLAQMMKPDENSIVQTLWIVADDMNVFKEHSMKDCSLEYNITLGSFPISSDESRSPQELNQITSFWNSVGINFSDIGMRVNKYRFIPLTESAKTTAFNHFMNFQYPEIMPPYDQSGMQKYFMGEFLVENPEYDSKECSVSSEYTLVTDLEKTFKAGTKAEINKYTAQYIVKKSLLSSSSLIKKIQNISADKLKSFLNKKVITKRIQIESDNSIKNMENCILYNIYMRKQKNNMDNERFVVYLTSDDIKSLSSKHCIELDGFQKTYYK